MTVYSQSTAKLALWPEPIEIGYQLLGGGDGSVLAPRLDHLGIADLLFMSSIMALPRDRRPWGIATWLADVFAISRPTLYSLAKRVLARLTPPQLAALPEQQAQSVRQVEVNATRLKRTVLTAAFPGKIALRPLQEVLDEAFGERRSIGWLSELLTEAGQRAGQVLGQLDFSGVGPVLVLRDETFFQDHPVLFMVDPLSSTILSAVVAPDRQADTWGLLLMMAQEQGVEIAGLVEDMARMYPKSLREADLTTAVQKDLWHLQRDGGQLCRDLERVALRATKQVFALEAKLRKTWDEALFLNQYIPAVQAEEQRYAHHAAFVTWFGHLCDALEIVDLPSGAIRDQQTNAWLLHESLAALSRIDAAQVQQWVKTVRRHQAQLLTWMAWLTPALSRFQTQLAQVLEHPLVQTQFMQLVAQHWRLRQALLNGHRQWRPAADRTTTLLQSVIAGAPALAALAQQLAGLLDAACRTSSLVECINGLWKQFLHNRRSFPSAEAMQTYLNLFTLWHNMRIYQRGKRQGQSPYQRAGIQLPTADWLELLGYTAA
jgi:hypothetical protein